MAGDDGVIDNFPSELHDRLTKFDDSLSEVEDIFKELHSYPLIEIHENLSPLEKAKLDLVGVFAMNSLFWMYLNVRGENPKEHGVKQEMDRIRSYMKRVQDIEDKAKAPKLDMPKAKRFIRSSLWQQAHQKTHNTPGKDTTGSQDKT